MDETCPAFHRRLRFDVPAEAELYQKLGAHQWNASTEIDWSRPVQTVSPVGPMNELLESTFRDLAHRLRLIGPELRA